MLIGSNMGFFARGAQAVATPTTLNPSDKSSDIALSNGNLTWMDAAGAATASVRTLASFSAGKLYFEFNFAASCPTALYTSIGFCNSSYVLSSYPGANAADSVGMAFNFDGSSLRYYGAGGTHAALCTRAHWMGVAVDIPNKSFWIRDVTSGMLWNGSAGSDPEAGTQAATFSFTGAVYVVANGYAGRTNQGGDFNFGQNAFAGIVPAGFLAGFGS